MIQTLILNMTLVARTIVFLGALLLPLVIVPETLMPLGSVKVLAVAFIGLVPIILWILSALIERKASVAAHPLSVAALLVTASALLAVLFSDAPMHSLFGHGYERDTFFMIAGYMGLIFSIPWLFRGARALRDLFFASAVGFVVLGVVHFVRLIFGGDAFLSTWIGASMTQTPLGSWNDVGVYAGFVIVGALALLLFHPLTRVYRVLMSALIVFALFLLSLVQVEIVWTTLAFTIFFLVVYRLSLMSHEQSDAQALMLEERPRTGFVMSAIVFCVSLIFVVFGAFLGPRMATTFGVEHVDVRPSWQGTLAGASFVYEDNLLFGVGPALFDTVWSQTRDVLVNESVFWDAEFSFGIGMLPTFFVTLGLIGGFAWVFFIGSWGYGAVQFLRTKNEDRLMHAVTVLWLATSGYLLALFVLYVPHTVMVTLTVLAVGAFLSALLGMHIVSKVHMQTKESSFAAFVLPSVLGVLLLLTTVLLVSGLRPVMASLQGTRAAHAVSLNDLDAADAHIAKAIRWYNSDDIEQVDSGIALARLAQVLGTVSEDAPLDTEQAKALIGRAVESAQQATRVAPYEFKNWIFLARTYEQVSGVVGEEALVSAKNAYVEAEKYAPTHPSVPLLQARLAFAQNNADEARTYITEAVKRKNNYTDAYFLLSQIEIEEGNAPEAIASTESAVLLSPNNAGLRFQLGFLYFASGSFQNAADILQTAITLNPEYANALYFLGLSYDRLDRVADAQKAFEQVASLNPENKEVAAIVSGLKEGVSAQETLASLQTTAPDARTVPPVSEVTTPVVE